MLRRGGLFGPREGRGNGPPASGHGPVGQSGDVIEVSLDLVGCQRGHEDDVVEHLLQEVRAQAVDVRAERLHLLEGDLERLPDPAAIGQHEDDERGGLPPTPEENHLRGLTEQGVHGLQQLDDALRGAPVQVVDDQDERPTRVTAGQCNPQAGPHQDDQQRGQRGGKRILQSHLPQRSRGVEGERQAPERAAHAQAQENTDRPRRKEALTTALRAGPEQQARHQVPGPPDQGPQPPLGKQQQADHQCRGAAHPTTQPPGEEPSCPAPPIRPRGPSRRSGVPAHDGTADQERRHDTGGHGLPVVPGPVRRTTGIGCRRPGPQHDTGGPDHPEARSEGCDGVRGALTVHPAR